ncbi:MAG TPA: glycosyltransferase family 9 protein [Baekduia sp.]|uniref:glycosyltransferase family 9 protein n=1 Tax=Baekduia sp. TaxID=2600305 RepID=UPI002D77596B|nr:glycosyltransferase family 9 protein [Baekduia sp.]HET6509498.1 glycosyltransferase family 9 protein [Baekduia sp.]
MPAYATERLKDVDRPLSLVAAVVGRAIGAAASAARAADGRLLVVRPGGMGDLIAAQIAVEELGRDPRADVRWVVERRSAAWARNQGLDHVAYDDRPAAALAALAGRHAVVVNTEQLFGLSQGLTLAAGRRGGRAFAFATNRGSRAAIRVPYDAYDEHETVAFGRLLAVAWGLPFAPDAPPRPRARRRPSDGTLLVAVSGRQSPTRSLGVEQWAAIARAWAAGRPLTVVAAPIDRAFADELAAQLGAGATREDHGFDALCDRIARAEGLLTMDGGPVHIASYHGTPTRTIFTSGREGKWAPLAEGSEIVRTSGLWCQPCTLFGQTPPTRNALACHRLDPVADVSPSPALLAAAAADV